MAKQPEKAIENDILDFLSTVPGAFFWKVNSTGVFDPKAKVFRKNQNKHVIKGVSDIIGLIDGKMIAIEVKRAKTEDSAKTYPSKARAVFLCNVRDAGGYGCVARSVADVQEFLLLVVKDVVDRE